MANTILEAQMILTGDWLNIKMVKVQILQKSIYMLS